MFVDASALVAILLREPEADDLSLALEAARIRLTSPIALYETVLALMSRRRFSRIVAEDLVRRFIENAAIEIIPITGEIGRAALDAFDRYGKGRGHPAQLNMGDCFAHAAARVRGVKLL